MQKKTIIIIASLVVAIAVAVVLAVTLSGGKTTPSSGKSNDNVVTPSPTPAQKNVSDSDLLSPTPSNGTSTNSSTPAPTPASDPEKDPAIITMLAVGDWGSTTGKISSASADGAGPPGSCCKLYTNGAIDTTKPRYNVDFFSQLYVADIMAKSAGKLDPRPSRIIGHGDNIYWDGAGPDDIQYRMEETFEKVYNQPELAGIKWVNVAGNHDIGGSEYICGDKDNNFRECKDTAEMLKYLNLKFTLQANYQSPNNNRWLMKDHYYVESVEKDGVTVEIYNLDTNHAESHGASQVCCQCYGYSKKLSTGNSDKQCTNVLAGDKLCAGGDVGMYKACMDLIEKWGQDSMDQAARDMAKSNATFKIINTHYSPHFHMAEDRMMRWYNLTKSFNVHAWFNGHTHGFNHDVAKWGTHFFENGGGGGIITETSTQGNNKFLNPLWVAGGNPYGFMELSFSKDWLKVQFASFDKSWSFGGFNLAATNRGGVAKGHCWYIPRITGTLGVKCSDSNDAPIGAPIV
ncbi:calcineurin-like phosphoesterase [Thraustotheca clavata]|uniref:Calcineurin-like phosphoesterase n=1 Tax=Thraustotheca clavata TaxID=74557 RepID=A0A0A7CLV1_9STRA|nr:secreted protein [Thraustotheca clavata]OQS05832.1 calcineurin-like phosphoesterase [Thraustotheca clavata]